MIIEYQKLKIFSKDFVLIYHLFLTHLFSFQCCIYWNSDHICYIYSILPLNVFCIFNLQREFCGAYNFLDVSFFLFYIFPCKFSQIFAQKYNDYHKQIACKIILIVFSQILYLFNLLIQFDISINIYPGFNTTIYIITISQ